MKDLFPPIFFLGKKIILSEKMALHHIQLFLHSFFVCKIPIPPDFPKAKNRVVIATEMAKHRANTRLFRLSLSFCNQ